MMSSYIKNTKHPETGEFEPAAWIDNYFRPHAYGVKFLSDPQVYSPYSFDLETNEDDPMKTWDDFFPAENIEEFFENATKQVTTESVLAERGNRYGNYLEQTKISNKIKEAMQEVPDYWDMETDIKDALEMIAVKMSRIVNGDPNYADNWADIAGYATLVKDRLEGNERK